MAKGSSCRMHGPLSRQMAVDVHDVPLLSKGR